MRRDPHNHLTITRIDLTVIQAILPNRWDTLTLLADPLTASAYDQSSGSGISDPTPTAAHALVRYHEQQDRVMDKVVALQKAARALRDELDRIPTDIDTAAIARQHRCTGGQPATDAWTRPECQNLAITRDGLCDACRQRKDHHQRKEAAA